MLKNNSVLISCIARTDGIYTAAASRALDVIATVITKTLTQGDVVTMIGLAKLYVVERESRNGGNKCAGETICIKPANSSEFRAGKVLEDTVN